MKTANKGTLTLMVILIVIVVGFGILYTIGYCVPHRALIPFPLNTISAAKFHIFKQIFEVSEADLETVIQVLEKCNQNAKTRRLSHGEFAHDQDYKLEVIFDEGETTMLIFAENSEFIGVEFVWNGSRCLTCGRDAERVLSNMRKEYKQ